MQIKDWKIFYINKDGDEANIALSSDQALQIKFWYIYFVDIEKDELIIEVPENYEEKKSEYFAKQMDLEILEVNKEFQAKVQMLTADYTPEEVASFDIKILEAQKVLDGWSSPFLEGLLIEGEDLDGLVEKIMTNATAYKTAYAMFEKELREKTKAIKDKYNV